MYYFGTHKDVVLKFSRVKANEFKLKRFKACLSLLFLRYKDFSTM